MERWQRSLAANKRQTQDEMTILSPEELNVLKSGYVDAFDDALEVLESARHVKPPDINT
jgi:enoyl-CoA hydratase/carnithine racemase